MATDGITKETMDAKSTEGSRRLVAMAKRLHAEKASWDSLCQEIAAFFYPQRADFTEELDLGEEFTDHLSDSAPARFCRELADAMGSYMRPSNQEWFKLVVDGLSDDDLVAKQHLEKMTKRTRQILYNRSSMFRQSAAEADRDFAAFGVSIMSITHNRRRNGLLYRTWHPRDCAWGLDDELVVDRIFRKDTMTVRNIAAKFGEEDLPQEIINALRENKPDEKISIYHCCVPRDLYDASKIRIPEDVQYVSVYLTKGGGILKEAIEPVFPYVVARWQTMSGKPYPYSPACSAALPDARLVNRLSEVIIEAAEKSVDPPMLAVAEAVSGPIDISSGAVTWIENAYDERTGKPLEPLDMGKNPYVGHDLLHKRQLDLRSSFFLDKLSLPDPVERRTATEALQLQQEFIRNALPLFEPLESEVAGQQLELTVVKAMQLNLYGKPEDFPQSLADTDISFDYENPLRQAIEGQTIPKFQGTLGVIKSVGELDPAAAKQFDLVKITRDTALATGKANWLLTEEDAQEAIAEEAAKVEAQQEMNQAGQASAIAKEGSSAIKNVADAEKSSRESVTDNEPQI